MKSGSNTKKPPNIKQKEQEAQTDSKHTQMTLCAESEFAENAEEFLDVIDPEKYIISNFNETSEIQDQPLRTVLQMTNL